MRILALLVAAALLAACGPQAPKEPKTPRPKVDFNHERTLR